MLVGVVLVVDEFFVLFCGDYFGGVFYGGLGVGVEGVVVEVDYVVG